MNNSIYERFEPDVVDKYFGSWKQQWVTLDKGQKANIINWFYHGNESFDGEPTVMGFPISNEFRHF